MAKRKIYTRTGDDGTTSLIGGGRASKNDCQVTAYGDLDELNATVGVCRSFAYERKRDELAGVLETIQRLLFEVGSILATKSDSPWPGMPEITDKDILQLENWIDHFEDMLPELKNFILPGGDVLSSHLHVARAVCRRSERSIIELRKSTKIPENIPVYINRLSDLLFVLARVESFASGIKELIWTKRNS